MKAILISIQPKWCELIANGKKTVEVRKTRPKLETPFKVYIYCTNSKPVLGRCIEPYLFEEFDESDFDYYNRDVLFKANGKVIGEFVCDRIDEYTNYSLDEQRGYIKRREDLLRSACMTLKEWRDYIGNYRSDFGYAWHISDLIIYDNPKELNEFSNIDNVTIKKCEHRERIYNNPTFTNGAYLPGGYICNKSEVNWCSKCKTKSLLKPPQSWCYVEELR